MPEIRRITCAADIAQISKDWRGRVQPLERASLDRYVIKAPMRSPTDHVTRELVREVLDRAGGAGLSPLALAQALRIPLDRLGHALSHCKGAFFRRQARAHRGEAAHYWHPERRPKPQPGGGPALCSRTCPRCGAVYVGRKALCPPCYEQRWREYSREHARQERAANPEARLAMQVP